MANMANTISFVITANFIFNFVFEQNSLEINKLQRNKSNNQSDKKTSDMTKNDY